MKMDSQDTHIDSIASDQTHEERLGHVQRAATRETSGGDMADLLDDLQESAGNRAVNTFLQRSTVQRASEATEGMRVMRIPERHTIQRAASTHAGAEPGHKESLAQSPLVQAAEEEHRRGEAYEVTPDIVARIDRQRDGGESLDAPTRHTMETTLGHDFGAVRVHRNAEADSLCRDVYAAAFATRDDIFFREGNYAPQSGSGQELLAHELTHVASYKQTGAPTNALLDDHNVQRVAEVAEETGGKGSGSSEGGTGGGSLWPVNFNFDIAKMIEVGYQILKDNAPTFSQHGSPLFSMLPTPMSEDQELSVQWETAVHYLGYSMDSSGIHPMGLVAHNNSNASFFVIFTWDHQTIRNRKGHELKCIRNLVVSAVPQNISSGKIDVNITILPHEIISRGKVQIAEAEYSIIIKDSDLQMSGAFDMGDIEGDGQL